MTKAHQCAKHNTVNTIAKEKQSVMIFCTKRAENTLHHHAVPKRGEAWCKSDTTHIWKENKNNKIRVITFLAISLVSIYSREEQNKQKKKCIRLHPAWTPKKADKLIND